MNEWWNSLGPAMQVFYTIGIVSTLFVCIQLILLLLGFTQDMDVGEGDVDVDMDMDVDAVDADAIGTDVADAGAADVDMDGMDADAEVDDVESSGLRLLSIRTVTAFFVGFGWGGAVGLQRGLSLPKSILVATGIGAVFMGIVFYLMKFFYSLRYSGSLDYKNAVGTTGTVYMAIPPNKSGAGKVQVKVQGRLKTIDAVTEANRKLSSQSRVRVVGMQDGNTLVVEPL